MAVLSLNSNVASERAQTQLHRSTEKLQEGFKRLSSGLRVNSARDDAGGLSIAVGIHVDRRVFMQGLRNVNDGISLLSIASETTEALSSVAIRMRELATQASNGSLSDVQRIALDKEAQALVSEYNRIFTVSEFNGIRLFAVPETKVEVQAGYGEKGVLVAKFSYSVTDEFADGTFQSNGTISAVGGTNGATVADFNGDGRFDIAMPDDLNGSVGIFLGNGNGTFQARQAYSLGGMPTSITHADFNGDGIQDLVTADYSAASVKVLRGNGNGTFQAAQSFTVGSTPTFVTAADLNGDGAQDIITTDSGSSGVSVLLGNGDGTFQVRQTAATGTNPYAVAVADFNKDGNKDLVIANYGSSSASILFGNGNGTFQPQQTLATGAMPSSVDVGDVNGDGNDDFVTADYWSNTISVFMGNGNGTFQPRQTYQAGGRSFSIKLADLNDDNVLDVVSTASADDEVSILIGNGDGTFQNREEYATGMFPVFADVADFNGDGVNDLIVANLDSGNGSILLGDSSVITQSFGIRAMQGVSLATQQSAIEAQSTLDSYLDQILGVSGAIGASQSRFEVAASNLLVVAENFASAESQIMDADIAEETANLVKNRILREAGSAVLAQANQLPALALSLLR